MDSSNRRDADAANRKHKYDKAVGKTVRGKCLHNTSKTYVDGRLVCKCGHVFIYRMPKPASSG